LSLLLSRQAMSEKKILASCDTPKRGNPKLGDRSDEVSGGTLIIIHRIVCLVNVVNGQKLRKGTSQIPLVFISLSDCLKHVFTIGGLFSQ